MKKPKSKFKFLITDPKGKTYTEFSWQDAADRVGRSISNLQASQNIDSPNGHRTTDGWNVCKVPNALSLQDLYKATNSTLPEGVDGCRPVTIKDIRRVMRAWEESKVEQRSNRPNHRLKRRG